MQCVELEFEWTSNTPSFLEGFRVAGARVLSPGLLVELALNLHSDVPTLSALRFGLPVPANADCKLLARLEESGTFAVIGGDSRSSTPRAASYVAGRVAEPGSPLRLAPRPQTADYQTTLVGTEFYERLAALGVHVDPEARVVRNVRATGTDFLAQIALNHEQAADAGSYLLHPLFGDAAIALARFAAGDDAVKGDPESMRYLLAIETLRVLRPMQVVVSAEAVLSKRAAVPVTDVVLKDASGEVVAEILGIELGSIEAAVANQHALATARVLRTIPLACPVAEVGLDDDLIRLGLTSLDLVRLRSALDTEFGLAPSWNEILGQPSPRALVDYYLQARVYDVAPEQFEEDLDTAPLSLAQEELWFLHQVRPERYDYHIHIRLNWRGRFDADAFESALRLAIERNSQLTCVFDQLDGVPVQRTNRGAFERPQFVSFAHLDQRSRRAALDELISVQQRTPFDLARGPLYRTAVAAASSAEHLLLFTFSHLVMDGWSLEVFLRAVVDGYAALVVGREPAPASRQPSYVGFARHERHRERAGLLARDREFWRNALAGLLPLNLPVERGAIATGTSESVRLDLAPSAAAGLRAVARLHGTTPFVVCCAAFVHLLRRYAGQSTIAIATVVSGRDRAVLDRVVGLFSRNLLLRFDLDDANDFAAMIAEVRRALLNALEHKDLPFSEVLSAGDGTRSTPDNPLFNVAILDQTWNFATPAVPEVEADFEFDGLDAAPRGTSRHDLELILAEIDGGLRLEFKFRTSVFQRSFVERAAAQYRELLDAAVAGDPAWSDLPRVGHAELAEVSRAWQSTALAYDREATLSEIFEARVAEAPDRVAVIDAERELTYRQLYEASERLACALRADGARIGDRVGICLDRTIDLAVAMLGILKAGAAYVPLDVRLPAARLDWIASDAAVTRAVTKRALVGSIPAAATRFVLDDEQLGIEASSGVATVVPRCGADDLAYVMYTSGSTGQPKGVAVQVGNLLNFVVGMDACVPEPEKVVWLALTPASFDIAILELLWPLMRGGRVVIGELPTPGVASNWPSFVDRALRDGVTHLQCTPSVARYLLDDADGVRVLSGIRHLLVGGEALPASLAARLQSRVRGSVHNMYGPTETTIWSSAWRVDDGAHGILIGRPIANTTFYVLDEAGRPVPQGLCGELYIAGDGVARGYLNRPEETAYRFVPDVFRDGRPMYRTGDVVRDRGAGLEWVGRLDRQVKVRGNRVELQEIEASLEAIPGVRRCVASLEASGSEQDLVAFVVPDVRDGERDGVVTHTEAWRQVWNHNYVRSLQSVTPHFDLRGWVRLADGAAFTAAEMEEWVSSAVQLVLAQKPKRVLDIGCGTGLLLFRLLPFVEHYEAYDLSEEAIRHVERNVDDSLRSKLVLGAQPIQALPLELGQRFDLVILNSVVQYLGDLREVDDLLSGVAKVLQPNGRVFVGDVRSLELAYWQHAVIADERPHAVRSKQFEQEEELLIDPAYFVQRAEAGFQGGVEVRLKAGALHNELTRYRYDVLLGGGVEVGVAVVWQDWSSNAWSLAALDEWLRRGEDPCLGLAGIPNARLNREHALAMAATDAEHERAIDREPVDPDAMMQVARAHGYVATPIWAGPSDAFVFDLLVHRPPVPTTAIIAERLSGSARTRVARPLANDPLRPRRMRDTQTLLAAEAARRLPAWMMPARFVVLDDVPLTLSGKVDYRALRAHAKRTREEATELLVPRDDYERAVASAWEEVLERPPSVGSDFFASGGNSLAVIRLVSKLRDRGFRVGPEQVFKCPSVAELAALLRNGPHGSTPLDLAREASLPDDVRVEHAYRASGVVLPLLTGATGFVGAHLLAEMAGRFAQIVCLVRGKSLEEARTRLRAALERWALPAAVMHKTVVVLADLARPRFGLEDAAWDALADEIDVVYHCAAEVNFVKPYEQLKAANVAGTLHILRFACWRKTKPVHYVSTIAVADAASASGVHGAAESDPLERWWELRDGYSRSKWVAERIARLAAARGLPLAIYRPGVVLGSAAVPKVPDEDAIARTLRTVIAMRKCFATTNRVVSHLCPVDDVARMIVRLSLEETSLGEVFHVCDPTSVDLAQLLDIARSRGHEIAEVDDAHWSAAVQAAGLDDWAVRRLESGELVVRVDCVTTGAALGRIGERWRQFDREQFARMIDELVRPVDGYPGGFRSS